MLLDAISDSQFNCIYQWPQMLLPATATISTCTCHHRYLSPGPSNTQAPVKSSTLTLLQTLMLA